MSSFENGDSINNFAAISRGVMIAARICPVLLYVMKLLCVNGTNGNLFFWQYGSWHSIISLLLSSLKYTLHADFFFWRFICFITVEKLFLLGLVVLPDVSRFLAFLSSSVSVAACGSGSVLVVWLLFDLHECWFESY